MKNGALTPDAEISGKEPNWSIRDGSSEEAMEMSLEETERRLMALYDALGTAIDPLWPEEARNRQLNMGILAFAIETVAPGKISGDDLEEQILAATREGLNFTDEQRYARRQKAPDDIPVLKFINYLVENNLLQPHTLSYAKEIVATLLKQEV